MSAMDALLIGKAHATASTDTSRLNGHSAAAALQRTLLFGSVGLRCELLQMRDYQPKVCQSHWMSKSGQDVITRNDSRAQAHVTELGHLVVAHQLSRQSGDSNASSDLDNGAKDVVDSLDGLDIKANQLEHFVRDGAQSAAPAQGHHWLGPHIRPVNKQFRRQLMVIPRNLNHLNHLIAQRHSQEQCNVNISERAHQGSGQFLALISELKPEFLLIQQAKLHFRLETPDHKTKSRSGFKHQYSGVLEASRMRNCGGLRNCLNEILRFSLNGWSSRQFFTGAPKLLRQQKRQRHILRTQHKVSISDRSNGYFSLKIFNQPFSTEDIFLNLISSKRS